LEEFCDEFLVEVVTNRKVATQQQEWKMAAKESELV
jgi:hypothetical protein